jgi:hypothetical protein
MKPGMKHLGLLLPLAACQAAQRGEQIDPWPPSPYTVSARVERQRDETLCTTVEVERADGFGGRCLVACPRFLVIPGKPTELRIRGDGGEADIAMELCIPEPGEAQPYGYLEVRIEPLAEEASVHHLVLDLPLLQSSAAPSEVPHLLLVRGEKRAGKVSVHVVEEDVRRVVEAIAQAAGVQIEIDAPVRGNVTLRAENLLWESALGLALESVGCDFERERSGVVRVFERPSARGGPDAPVELAYDQADIQTVIQTIAHQSGADIQLAPEVAGKVTLSVDGASWRSALQAAVDATGCVVEEDSSGRVLRVKVVEPRPVKCRD